MFCCALGVEKEFIPWLIDSVETQLNVAMVSRQLIDAVICDVVRTRAEQYSQLPHVTAPDEPELAEPVVDTTITIENEDEQQASGTVL